MKLLKPLETTTCPFRQVPPSNERPHWVQPTLVAQIRFTEWTAEGRLRHPVYLGLRDDKKAGRRGRARRNLGSSSSHRVVRRQSGQSPAHEPPATSHQPPASPQADLIDQLTEIERAHKDVVLSCRAAGFGVTNLHKMFWPGQKLTKGDLLRYYCRSRPSFCPPWPIGRS